MDPFALVDAMRQALERRDADGLAAVLHPDVELHLYSQPGVIAGREAARAWYRQAFASRTIFEGEERTLRPWDFVHCPGGTAHVIVGAGEVPAVVLAVGARGGRRGLVYLREPAALARGAGIAQETTRPAEAYRPFPRPVRCSYRPGWLPPLA